MDYTKFVSDRIRNNGVFQTPILKFKFSDIEINEIKIS